MDSIFKTLFRQDLQDH